MSIFPALKRIDDHIKEIEYFGHSLDRIVAEEDRLDLLKDTITISQSFCSDSNTFACMVGVSNNTCANISD